MPNNIHIGTNKNIGLHFELNKHHEHCEHFLTSSYSLQFHVSTKKLFQRIRDPQEQYRIGCKRGICQKQAKSGWHLALLLLALQKLPLPIFCDSLLQLLVCNPDPFQMFPKYTEVFFPQGNRKMQQREWSREFPSREFHSASANQTQPTE